MNTEQMLDAVKKIRENLDTAKFATTQGSMASTMKETMDAAVKLGANLGMAHAEAEILEQRLTEQLAREKAKFEAEAKAFNARVDKATQDWLRHLDGDQ